MVVDVAVVVIVVVLVVVVVVVAVVVVLVVDIVVVVVVVAAVAVVVCLVVLVVCGAVVHGVIAHHPQINTHPNNQKQNKCKKNRRVTEDILPVISQLAFINVDTILFLRCWST